MLEVRASAVRLGTDASPQSHARNCEARRTASRPSICFVSETKRVERPLLDPSVRYRCYHPAEALSAQGYRVTVTSAATFFDSPSFEHDAYIFHRPNASRRFFDRVLDQLQSLGRTLVADLDDLIFGSEEVALVSSIVKNGRAGPANAVRMFRSNARALERFDRFSVSTAPLADRVRAIRPGAKIAVVANELPESVLRPHRELGTAVRKRNRKIIGYFAGTRSHDADFPIVKEVLHRVLSEDCEKSLLVVGPVELPYAVSSLPNVRVRNVVPFWHLPDLMSGCDTVIAPLEDTLFNQCKSRVKFLEAAIAGCRLVATPIPDMASVGENRITFATKPDEWYEALSAPLDEGSQRLQALENLGFVEQRSSTAILKGVGEF